MKLPGPDHPITIEPNPKRVVVRAAGRVIADTDRALTLREGRLAPVFYVPREDTNMDFLTPTRHATYCPYKGDCSYFSIPVAGERSVNASWSYVDPYPAVAAIRGYLAFYPSRVDAIEEHPAE